MDIREFARLYGTQTPTLIVREALQFPDHIRVQATLDKMLEDLERALESVAKGGA